MQKKTFRFLALIFLLAVSYPAQPAWQERKRRRLPIRPWLLSTSI